MFIAHSSEETRAHSKKKIWTFIKPLRAHTEPLKTNCPFSPFVGRPVPQCRGRSPTRVAATDCLSTWTAGDYPTTIQWNVHLAHDNIHNQPRIEISTSRLSASQHNSNLDLRLETRAERGYSIDTNAVEGLVQA